MARRVTEVTGRRVAEVKGRRVQEVTGSGEERHLDGDSGQRGDS